MTRTRHAPAGYTRFHLAGTDVVALASCAGAVGQAVDGRSLYAYAATHPARRELRGRGAAYAVPLPGDAARVVVRHSRHGGLLARITGDRFVAPTRAPRELRTALRLSAAGVGTPEVIAYATYPAGPLLRRSDVATREIAGGADLVALLGTALTPDDRAAVLNATAELLRALARSGAHHPDLNIANVLIVTDTHAARRALVLDVDRVRFGQPGDPAIGAANLRRLLRSARKHRAHGRVDVRETELAELVERATP